MAKSNEIHIIGFKVQQHNTSNIPVDTSTAWFFGDGSDSFSDEDTFKKIT